MAWAVLSTGVALVEGAGRDFRHSTKVLVPRSSPIDLRKAPSLRTSIFERVLSSRAGVRAMVSFLLFWDWSRHISASLAFDKD